MGEASISETKIGDKMPDGSIYAGTSPSTRKPMYAMPADAPLIMKWKQAMEYADRLDAHGHLDWRLPSSFELNVLFENHAAIGGFEASGSDSDAWYWSSSPYKGGGSAYGQRFSDGSRDIKHGYEDLFVRCVR